MTTENRERDITNGQGVVITYEIIRAFNRTFHHAELPPFEDAGDAEQARATSAYVWIRDNPELGAEDLHEEWRSQMIAEGWSFGEYDEEAKTHPHICPFDDIPPWSRRMLHLTITTVNILASPIEMLEEVMNG